MHKLETPISREAIEALHVGDTVSLSGIVVTGRDAAHKYIHDNFIKTGGDIPASERAVHDRLKELLDGSLIYHCGPIVEQADDGSYRFIAAGPTTSVREEPYQAGVLEYFNVRGVIGKGGMLDKTAAGLQKTGACYFHAIGGAGTFIAKRCKQVLEVLKKEEFGTPEAFWVIRVEDFPVVVTMDAHGGSLHRDVAARSKEALSAIQL